MFKDIFPDKINRFVYKQGGGAQETFGGKGWERDEEGTPLGRWVTKKGKREWQMYTGGKKGYDALKKRFRAGLDAVKAVEKQREKPSSAEDLDKEADKLIASIDKFAKQIQANLDASGGEKKAKKIDLKDPSSYKHLKDDFTRTEVWYTLERLRDARNVCEKRKGSGDMERVGLEYARIILESAKEFYKDALMHEDVLRRPSEEAKLKKVSRARPEAEVKAEKAAALAASKEVKEASDWVTMAKLVKRYLFLGNTPTDRKVKDRLQIELKALAEATFKAQDGKRMKVVSPDKTLVITKAKGAGAPAFMFDIQLERELGHAKSAKKYTERMYAGGSAKDFPDRPPLVKGPEFTAQREKPKT